MSAQSEFRQSLESGDVRGLRRASAILWPHLPQPKSDAEAEISMHHARTQAKFLPLSKRAWSHRWLCERSLPSGLPDALRPRAERICPRIIPAVGISVKATSEFLRLAAPIVRGAMEDAVREADADGRLEDAAFVTARMREARQRAMRTLFGRGFDGQG